MESSELDARWWPHLDGQGRAVAEGQHICACGQLVGFECGEYALQFGSWQAALSLLYSRLTLN